MNYGPINEPLVIYLTYPEATCCICGEITPSCWGVPVSSKTALVISNDSPEDWGAKPACKSCHDRHANGEFVGSDPMFG